MAMSEQHHAPEHLGEECPSCGVVHRVVESIPDKPLSRTAIDSLEASEGIEYAEGVEFFFGEMAGPNAEEATENLILSTSSSTKLLSRYAGTGWIIEQEIEHEPDEDPEQVGQELWMEASQHLSAAMNEVFRDQ
jgi:hypothetical protein